MKRESPKYKEVYTTNPGDIWELKNPKDANSISVDKKYPRKVMVLDYMNDAGVIHVLDITNQSKLYLAAHRLWLDYKLTHAIETPKAEQKEGETTNNVL